MIKIYTKLTFSLVLHSTNLQIWLFHFSTALEPSVEWACINPVWLLSHTRYEITITYLKIRPASIGCTFNSGHVGSRAPNVNKMGCPFYFHTSRAKVQDAYSFYPTYSILQGVQLELQSGRTRYDRLR